MGSLFKSLKSSHQKFIEKQKLFFVASADQDGKINLSPKGFDCLKILDKNRLIWLNLTGSGNETAAHVLAVNRMTIMFCSFDENPLILRLYGTAEFIQRGEPKWEELIQEFPEYYAPRQIFDMKIEAVQTSCGFGVPVYEFKNERTLLHEWGVKKGKEGILAYHKNRNNVSIDGKPTGINRNEQS